MENLEVQNRDIVIIKNLNRTLGYATFDTNRRELTYLFVNPAFLRKNFGNLLPDKAEETLG